MLVGINHMSAAHAIVAQNGRVRLYKDGQTAQLQALGCGSRCANRIYVHDSLIIKAVNMKKFTLNHKLGSMIVVLWIGLVAIGFAGAWQSRVSAMDDRQDQLRALVAQGSSMTARLQSLSENKTISEDEAKKRALDVLASMRYGKDGYISVNDSRGIMIMSPTSPAMNGRDVSGVKDKAGNKIFLLIIKAGSLPAGDFITYLWTKPGSDRLVKKLSFVQYFAPWDWFFVTGMYTDDIDAAFFTSALHWLGITTVLGLLASVAMLLVLRSIKRELGGDPSIAVDTAQRIARGDLSSRVPGRFQASCRLDG